MKFLQEYVSADVRRWLYGVAVAVLPLAAAYGLVDNSTAPLWLSFIAAFLFLGAHANTPKSDGEGGVEPEPYQPTHRKDVDGD